MKITVEPVDATLGAVVTGVDIEHLDDRAWAAIHSAFLEHGVLVFPGQALSDAGQGAFARRFGDVEKLHPKQTNPTVMISNAKPDGTLSRPDEQQYRILKGNEGWHTDSTYMPLASKAAMLYALVLPPSGGETEFADMRAAWDALDPAMRAKLEQPQRVPLDLLLAVAARLHAYDRQYVRLSRQRRAAASAGEDPSRNRPQVDIHRPPRARHIRDGCGGVRTFPRRSPRICVHGAAHVSASLDLGDLVVWDNRCVLHRARPYDPNHPRVLRGSASRGTLRRNSRRRSPTRGPRRSRRRHRTRRR